MRGLARTHLGRHARWKIAVYSPDLSALGHLTTDGRIATTGTPFIVPAYRMIKDSHGILWIASKGKGIIRLEPHKGDKHYRLTQYTYDADNVYSLSHNSAYDICEDGKGRLWIATFGGGVNCMEQQPDGNYRFSMPATT